MTQISKDKLSILKFGIILMSFFGFFMFSSSVAAAPSDRPADIQPEDSGIYYTASSGSTSGTGGNLLYSPQVWIRVYGATNNGGDILFIHGNHCNAGSGWDSDTYRPTVFELHGTRADGSDTGAVKSSSTNSLQTGAGASGCGSVNLRIPANALTLSDEESHVTSSGTRLYVGIIKVYIQPGVPTESGPLNVFKVNGNGYRTGSVATGGSSTQTFLGRPGSDEKKNYVLPFKPPCSSFTGRNSIDVNLSWFDDDNGTSYQPPFTVKLVEYDENGTAVTNVEPINERSGEGKKATTKVTIRKGKRYEWVWEGMTNKNGVQVYYPYESSDFYFVCNRDVEYGVKDGNDLDCDRLTGWAYDKDVPTKAVAMTVTVDWPAGNPKATYLVQGKGANLPNQYVKDHFAPYAGNTNHGFDIDISDYTYPYAGNSRTFFLYFTDYNKNGSDTGDRGRSEAKVLNIQTKCKQSADSFKLSPTGSLKIVDPEEPANVDFTNIGVKKAFPRTVNKVTVTKRYFIKKLGGTTVELPSGVQPARLVNIPGNANYNFFGTPERVGLSGLNPGDQVCVTVTANPGKGKYTSTTSNEWQAGTTTPVTSPEDCETVVNKPFVSFYGGDVSAGGAFIGTPGSCSSPSNIATYTKADKKGSGVQYAAFSLGDIITNPGSSGGFNSARLRATTDPKPPKGLTFANKTATLGNFGGDHCIPDYFGDGTQNAGGFNDVFDFNKNSGDYFVKPAAGQQYNLSGKIPNGKRFNLYVQGDLRITGRGIEYASNNWPTLEAIPSLHVYVKGHIYIDPSVEVVTGMFVAQPIGVTKGTVFTCAKGVVRHDPDERFNSCNKPLKVNGSIIALKILLDRTSSSLRFANNEDTPSGSVGAEVFDLTPEHYIVAPGSRSTSSSNPPKFDYYTALPPIL